MTSPAPSTNGGSRPSRNLAARMGRWSADHRKLAIWGWLGFVVLAVVVGGAVGEKQIDEVDQFHGESKRAEQALDRSGLRPVDEVVFVRSPRFTVADPEFKATLTDVGERLAAVPHVRELQSPVSGGGSVSKDGHAALIDFQIAGDSIEARDRVQPALDAVAAAQERHPGFQVEQLGDASASEAVGDTIGDDLTKAGELSIPVTLIVLLIAFGTVVAAAVPLLLAITGVIAAMSAVALPSHVFPVDDNLPAVILLIGLAVGVDYSLFYIRRERESAPPDAARATRWPWPRRRRGARS